MLKSRRALRCNPLFDRFKTNRLGARILLLRRLPFAQGERLAFKALSCTAASSGGTAVLCRDGLLLRCPPFDRLRANGLNFLAGDSQGERLATCQGPFLHRLALRLSGGTAVLCRDLAPKLTLTSSNGIPAQTACPSTRLRANGHVL